VRVSNQARRSLKTTDAPARSFEGDLVDGFLDLVDDHVGQLGALFAVQSLT
jgi:hypothetical protein